MNPYDFISPEPNTGCWLWTGYLTGPQGYGGIWLDGKPQRAHRVMYEAEVGPIPGGLVIDHLCRQPSCVNPQHMEPVTNAENIQRGWPGNARKTHCPQGHEYSEENTYINNGKRNCRICQKASLKRFRARAVSGEANPQRGGYCRRGHALTDENTYQSPTGPQCRTCINRRARARYRLKRKE